RLVADATRTVLVDLDPRDIGEIYANAGIHHRIGEPGGLFGGHAAKKNRHQQHGRLILRKGSSGDAIDEESDLLSGKRAAITLLHNHVNCAHAVRRVYPAPRSATGLASSGGRADVVPWAPQRRKREGG